MAAIAQEPRQFTAHALHDGHGASHVVEAASFEEAAINFVETWHPGPDEDGDVSVIVRDSENGHEHCFLVEVATGEASPCE